MHLGEDFALQRVQVSTSRWAIRPPSSKLELGSAATSAGELGLCCAVLPILMLVFRLSAEGKRVSKKEVSRCEV